MPKLHWTAYYNYTNPLYLPLTNTSENIEKNKNMLYRLTTSLTPRQVTYVGYKIFLKTFTAPRGNDFAIEYYDHNIIRPNHDQFLDEDRFANPQLTKIFFIKTSYLFTLNIFDKKHVHIISEALVDIFFSLLTQNTRHQLFLILHIALKTLTSTASSATTTQSSKCIYSVPSRRPSLMKNQDPSLSRTNSYNLSKYPY